MRVKGHTLGGGRVWGWGSALGWSCPGAGEGRKEGKGRVYEELMILLDFWAQTSIGSNARP